MPNQRRAAASRASSSAALGRGAADAHVTYSSGRTSSAVAVSAADRAETPPPAFPHRIWHIAGYGLLIGLTVLAAVLLVPFHMEAGHELTNFDPQSPAKVLMWWRGGAVFAYTSGSGVGYVCAVLTGLLAAGWASGRRTRRAAPAATLVAGPGIRQPA
jgi:hypothetical protein